MRFEMFQINDYQAWGRLVKSWVKDPALQPKSLANFKTEVLKVDPSAKFPAQYTDLQFMPTSSTDSVLRIRLPPLDLLQLSEDELKTKPYDLPPFYPDLMYNSNLQNDTPPPAPSPVRMVFHDNRVGEYTIKFCG